MNQNSSDNLPYEKIGKNAPVCIADEVPFDIPDSWEWVRFKNLVNYLIGKTPPRKESSYWDSDDYKWVSISDMVSDGTILDTKECVNAHACKHIFGNRIIPEGTLLMSFKLTVGKVSILGIEALHNEAIISIFPYIDDKKATRDFLFVVLPLLSQYGNTKSAIKGNTLNSESLGNLFIPLPPLKEQKRIVEKYNTILPLLNNYTLLEGKVTKLNDNFPELLKKSILQEAVQGKLVPQDPNDEPASVLLERIREEKQRLIAEGKIKKDKHESVIFKRDNSHYEKQDSNIVCIDDELPFNIPVSWAWVRLGSLVQINPRNVCDDELITGFIPMGLIKEGFNDFHSFENKKWKDIKSGFTHLQNGDVVLAKITPCFQNRKSAIIKCLPNKYGAGTTELHVLRDNTDLLFLPYLLLVCKTHEFIENGIKNFTGTAGQQRISKDFVSNYLIPIPPVNEQKRIVQAATVLIEKTSILED